MALPDVALAEAVRSVAAGREVCWIPNLGNAGDALIAAGTIHFLHDHRIAYRVVENAAHFDGTGNIVCFGGGGNLVPQYGSARSTIERIHRTAGHLVILPHTIAGNEDLLSEFGTNVTIICREAVSLAHCRSAAPGTHVLAAHDMAFSVDPSRLPWPSSARPPAPIRARYESYRSKHIAFLAATGLSRELSVFRKDGERNPEAMSAPGNDISRLFQPPQQRLVEMMMAAHFFLATISAFEVIRTDRLHVAIAGALLGKRVELHANSYFKNRAVYDFSLRSFPNVRFVNRAA